LRSIGADILSGAARIGKPLFNSFREATRIFADFVYPPQCLLCGNRFESGRWLCPICLRRILESRRVVLHARPEDFPYLSCERHFDGVFTAWEFNPDLERLIHCAKYSGMKNLARFLGSTAADVLVKDAAFVEIPFQTMIPVPLHKIRQRERGYNQSRCVCDGLSESFGFPMLPDGLYRKRYTQTQTGKNGEEREENVKDAFRASQPERIRGRSVLLVDDVLTTGSTMNSCARTLKEAGAERVHGVTLARPLMGFFHGQMA
jgi:competence protein ComFC